MGQNNNFSNKILYVGVPAVLVLGGIAYYYLGTRSPSPVPVPSAPRPTPVIAAAKPTPVPRLEAVVATATSTPSATPAPTSVPATSTPAPTATPASTPRPPIVGGVKPAPAATSTPRPAPTATPYSAAPTPTPKHVDELANYFSALGQRAAQGNTVGVALYKDKNPKSLCLKAVFYDKTQNRSRTFTFQKLSTLEQLAAEFGVDTRNLMPNTGPPKQGTTCETLDRYAGPSAVVANEYFRPVVSSPQSVKKITEIIRSEGKYGSNPK